MTKERLLGFKGEKPHKISGSHGEREEKNIMYEFRARKYLYY